MVSEPPTFSRPRSETDTSKPPTQAANGLFEHHVAEVRFLSIKLWLMSVKEASLPAARAPPRSRNIANQTLDLRQTRPRHFAQVRCGLLPTASAADERTPDSPAPAAPSLG